MQKQTSKKQPQKLSNWHSIRITSETKSAAEKILKIANNKKAGRKIKLDEILQLAIQSLDDSHIKELQNSSLSNEDHTEFMRQYYIDTRGKIGRDQFLGFLISNDFPAFKAEYLEKQKLA